MPLPIFREDGNLPEGIWRATIDEVVARFGSGSVQREEVTKRLLRIYNLALATGTLERFIVFGSYVTEKAAPNDVDVILIMLDDFRMEACDNVTLALFDHDRADSEMGASIFWARPTMLFLETVEEFVAGWQKTREQTQRGIIEVIQ